MESRDFPRYINFTDAERTEGFVLCALHALRTTNSVSKRCGFDIATRPELCLREMSGLIPKIDDLLRLSKMADGNDASYIDAVANELVALALALRSGTLKALNLPRESAYMPPSHRMWHLRLTGSSDTIFTGSLTSVINYADDVLRPPSETLDGIEIAEAVSVRSCADHFDVSDVVYYMAGIEGDNLIFPDGMASTVKQEGFCASMQTSVRAVIGQFLPFKSYQYGRTCILSNLSEVDGKYVDKSNGMVLGEIGP